jgi:hypothetical protein
LIVLLAGALQTVCVWVAYYECRKALVGLSIGAVCGYRAIACATAASPSCQVPHNETSNMPRR